MRQSEREARDRDAIALLEETHCGAGSKYGLCWRLRVVDGLSIREIARVTGCRAGNVAEYLRRVNQQLLAAGHRGELPHVPALLRVADEALPDDEDETTKTLRELARAFRDAYRNRQEGRDQTEWALPPAGVLILRDFEDALIGWGVFRG